MTRQYGAPGRVRGRDAKRQGLRRVRIALVLGLVVVLGAGARWGRTGLAVAAALVVLAYAFAIYRTFAAVVNERRRDEG